MTPIKGGAVALVRDQLADELVRLKKLHELGMRLVQTDSLNLLLNDILGAALEITSADMGNIQLLGADGVLRIAAHSAGKPSLQAMLDAGALAVQSTPIFSRAGPLIGMLSTYYREPRRIAERDLQMIDVLARQAADLIENFRAGEALRDALEREHRIVQALQAAFLPPFLPQIDGVAFDAFYRPAPNEFEVGGDWFDVSVLRDGRIAISIGDVLGHGFEAAAAMLRLRETLRAVTGFVDDDPATILRLAERTLHTFHPETIASAVFAIYDPFTQRVRVANAGHPPPALIGNGRATFLPTGGALLNISAERVLPVYECTLAASDALVFYTDGLTESGRDTTAGESRLLRCLTGVRPNAEELVMRLASGDYRDDVAVLIFSVLPN